MCFKVMDWVKTSPPLRKNSITNPFFFRMASLRYHFEQQLWALYVISDNLPCFHVLPWVFKARKPVKEGGYLSECKFASPKKIIFVSLKIYGEKEVPLPKKVKISKRLHEK